MRYSFPREVTTDLSGFSVLAELYALGKRDDSGSPVVLDFSPCRWFEANMCAPLYSVIARFFEERKEVHGVGIHKDVMTVFQKNGFAKILRLPSLPDVNETTIPFVRFRPSETRPFAEYSTGKFREIFVKKNCDAPPAAFFESVNEIFQNSSVHARTDSAIASCGQFFPKSARIDFAISDCGVGIPRNVREFLKTDVGDEDAVVWAMSENNTTRTPDLNVSPGGLGLKIVRDFIDDTRGRLIIASGCALVCRSNGRNDVRRLESPFPGTCVNIEINTRAAQKSLS